jgi:hypothetical protein
MTGYVIARDSAKLTRLSVRGKIPVSYGFSVYIVDILKMTACDLI